MDDNKGTYLASSSPQGDRLPDDAEDKAAGGCSGVPSTQMWMGNPNQQCSSCSTIVSWMLSTEGQEV